MTEPSAEFSQYTTEDETFTSDTVIEPIHVVVDGQTEKSETPEFGSWQFISWPAATPAVVSAQPILPQARKRYEAQIVISLGAGAAATAFVRVGTFAQVTGNGGAQLAPGRYPYHAAQQVYVASDGVNAMNINVLDERYT
jgi:hypothetical protein